MILYLLKVLQSNEIENVKNQTFSDLIKECDGSVYVLDNIEAAKYLCALAFKDSNNREKFADHIPHIAFEYEDIDYPDEIMEKVENGTLFAEKPKWHKRPNICERKIEAWSERNGIEYKKEYRRDNIYYNFDEVEGLIIVDYKARYVMGGRAGADVRVTKEPRFVEDCLCDILEDFENLLVSKVVD